jgi:hypothetical protein
VLYPQGIKGQRLHKHCAAILIAQRATRRVRHVVLNNPARLHQILSPALKDTGFYCLLVSDLFDRGLHLIPASHHRDLREDAFENWGRAVA